VKDYSELMRLGNVARTEHAYILCKRTLKEEEEEIEKHIRLIAISNSHITSI